MFKSIHLQEYKQIEDVIPLSMIDVKLPMSELYRGITFAGDAEDH